MKALEKAKTSNRYSPEMRACAIRRVVEHQGSCETQPVPVILDNALVQSNDDRIEAMFAAVHRVA